MNAHVLVTGGSGFLGNLLVDRLLSGGIAIDGGPVAPVTTLTTLDVVAPAQDRDDDRLRVVTADLADGLADLEPVDVVFHLAGVVSGAAEQDFDLGMSTNLDQTRHLLEWCRTQPVAPVVVLASSLAVFGDDPHAPLPEVVDDDTMPRPQSSYGIQKFIAEQLVADYTRRGYVRGRSVRLMTVSVRPGRPNAAASSFLSGIIREPLAGERATCPVPPDTSVALSSPRRTLDGLLAAAATESERWGSRTAMNLPALTTSPAEMAAALDEATGEQTSRLIDWSIDPQVVDIVASWPGRFETARATRLGLQAEHTFADIVRAYLDDHPPDTTRS